MAVILLYGAVEADDAPKVILSVVRHREFMADFTGYYDYNLLDVYQWRTRFFDCRGGKREVIYRDVYISRKEKREELRRGGILVADAIRLARSALEHNTALAVCRII
ncbi:MAG: hypothetical protein LBS75_02260 [Synergistaceae bacterium]|jgi:hypothetical protein|nr:hypothetical protein [Synergistaceae bacterium]